MTYLFKFRIPSRHLLPFRYQTEKFYKFSKINQTLRIRLVNNIFTLISGKSRKSHGKIFSAYLGGTEQKLKNIGFFYRLQCNQFTNANKRAIFKSLSLLKSVFLDNYFCGSNVNLNKIYFINKTILQCIIEITN